MVSTLINFFLTNPDEAFGWFSLTCQLEFVLSDYVMNLAIFTTPCSKSSMCSIDIRHPKSIPFNSMYFLKSAGKLKAIVWINDIWTVGTWLFSKKNLLYHLCVVCTNISVKDWIEEEYSLLFRAIQFQIVHVLNRNSFCNHNVFIFCVSNKIDAIKAQ